MNLRIDKTDIQKPECITCKDTVNLDLEDIVNLLEKAPVNGSYIEKDSPEGVRYIQISETLKNKIIETLKLYTAAMIPRQAISRTIEGSLAPQLYVITTGGTTGSGMPMIGSIHADSIYADHR